MSLPDILAPLDANTRFRVFKTILLSGALAQGEPFLYALELLRTAFNYPATHDGLYFYSDKEGHAHTDFLFNVSPAKLRAEVEMAEGEALGILAHCDAVWVEQSNLWHHFGLPDDREAMRKLS